VHIVPPEQLDGSLERLLSERVHSHEELDALLLLYRERSRRWTPEKVACELEISEDSALGALDCLHARGLLVACPEARSFSYEPSSPALDAGVAALARIHAENRFTVIDAMNRHAFERMRHSVLRALMASLRERD
jgi:hypothetical protein